MSAEILAIKSISNFLIILQFDQQQSSASLSIKQVSNCHDGEFLPGQELAREKLLIIFYQTSL